MAWRRGWGAVQVELANVQSKLEQWSEILDGDEGLIQYVQNERSERDALRRFIKLSLWLGGLFVGAPAFTVSVIELIKLAHGK
jgi:hypothetical protein